MRLVRVRTADGQEISGDLVADGRVAPLLSPPWELPARFAAASVPFARLLAPLVPQNIFAIGRNYAAHAAETGSAVPERPMVFMKPTTAVLDPGGQIVIPASAPTEVDFEAELAVVIGRTARRVGESTALDHVFGYTCANDVSARDCQRNDKQWARAKGFDTFCPLGPWIVGAAEMNPQDRPIRSRLNGAQMQSSNTRDMIHGVRELVSYLSHQFTLLPGTLILTGTPDGVGMARKPPVFLKAGDTIEVEIDGIGTLTNTVGNE